MPTSATSARMPCASTPRRCSRRADAMAGFERGLLKRWTAAAFAKAGLALLAIGALPILLYAWLGPAHGNPIGLGLLVVVLVPVGFLLLSIAALKWLFARM